MDVKVGDRVNGHIINFVGDVFLEYGDGRRIYRRNITTVIPAEIIEKEKKEKAKISRQKRYSNEEYRKKQYAKVREYKKRNKDKEREWSRRYREKHKAEISKRHHDYVQTHREQINAYRRERYRKLREEKK